MAETGEPIQPEGFEELVKFNATELFAVRVFGIVIVEFPEIR